MRTTIAIADHLLVEAKRLAAAERTSLARIIEDSLRRYLAERREAPPASGTFELPTLEIGPLADGVDLTDTSALWEL